MKAMLRLVLALSIVLVLVMGCGQGDTSRQTNVSVPKGDPPFPPLTTSWVIDRAGVLSAETVSYGDAVFEQLKRDGIAEVVLLVQNGVKQPEKYSTHYGRWLKLGRKGMSTEGGNNGVVWLIRPDADARMTISVGEGLPRFTSVDYGDIMEKAKDYLNFNNFDKGVKVIVEETDRTLRQIYGKKSQ